MRVPFAYGASAVDATYVALGYEVMAGKEYVHNEVLESCVKILVVCVKGWISLTLLKRELW